MRFIPKMFPLLLLIALTTQRVNAGLGCDENGYLSDTSKCWVGDINRVFDGCCGMLTGCDGGYVSEVLGWSLLIYFI